MSKFKFNIITGDNAQEKYDAIDQKDLSTFYLLETGIGYFEGKKIFDATISTTNLIDDIEPDDNNVPTEKAIVQYIISALRDKVEYEIDGESGNESSGNISGGSTPSDVPLNVPVGSVIMWGKSVEEIPEGWHVCNGEAGTPDLRGRFIIGSNDKYEVGAIGGEEEHVLTTKEMPAHNHSISSYVNNAGSTSSRVVLTTTTPSGTKATTYTANTGESAAHNNMPPYYALVYIMKIS